MPLRYYFLLDGSFCSLETSIKCYIDCLIRTTTEGIKGKILGEQSKCVKLTVKEISLDLCISEYC